MSERKYSREELLEYARYQLTELAGRCGSSALVAIALLRPMGLRKITEQDGELAGRVAVRMAVALREGIELYIREIEQREDVDAYLAKLAEQLAAEEDGE